MSATDLSFWMTAAGTVCWVVCFGWMYQISAKQDRVMDQLREQGKRIEKLSRIEHDLIKEVHPQVGAIKEGLEEMIAVVKENTESQPMQKFQPRHVLELILDWNCAGWCFLLQRATASKLGLSPS